MTKRIMRIAVLLLATSLFTGCFSTAWLISLKKDGSGTIRMDFRMDKQVLDMMNSMGGESQDTATSSEAFMDREELEQLASEMGDGVRFVSAEPLPENEESVGYTAHFTFRDINALALDPMEGAPEQQAGEIESTTEEAPFTFSFTPGNTAELIVRIAQEDDRDDEAEGSSEEAMGEESSPEEQQMMAEMMKPYFRSMSFLVQIEFDGTIRSTDASYREENIVTLMDMDMGKIVDDDELFKRVINSDGFEDKEALELMEEAGVRIEQKDRVRVTFR
jgi:hypothetical protein